MRIVCDHELWPIEKVIPYHANIKKHPEAQINKLASMIAEYGWDVPLVADVAGVLIKGHGRLEAAKKLGLKEVPVIVRTDLSPAQVKAARIADNKVAESEWDLDNLKLEMGELDALDFDLDLTGFDDDEQEKLLAEPMGDGGGLTDPDAVPENVETRCKPGDLWELGRHRLVCGDATDQLVVDQALNGRTPVLMVTDPPYGVQYDATWREEALGDKIMGKARTGKVSNDDRADWYDVWAICEAKIAYVWHASAFADVVMDSLRRADFEVRQQIIWHKSVIAMSRSAYHWKHEPCWYAVRKGCDANWQGDRKQTTVWDAASPTHIMSGSKEEKTPHPTQKPIVLYTMPIHNHTLPGDLIYEPFGGSGTALMAAEKTNRDCAIIELDPKYCDVILKRWEDFTGKRATRIEE